MHGYISTMQLALTQCTWHIGAMHLALTQCTWNNALGTEHLRNALGTMAQCPLAQCTWTWHALGTMHLTQVRAHKRNALWHNALGRNALGSALAQCTWHNARHNALGTVHFAQRTWRNPSVTHLAQQCGSHMHWHIATTHVTMHLAQWHTSAMRLTLMAQRLDAMHLDCLDFSFLQLAH